jgi:hypothetical protein
MKIRVLVLVFVVFLLTLSVGYGALSTELNIGGDLVVKADRKAQIYEIDEVENFNVVTNGVSFEDDKIFGSALFNDVVDSNVTYLIKFRNNTDKDIVINNITSNGSINLNYEFIDLNIGSVIKAGDLISFKVKLSLNSGVVATENFEFVFDIQEYIE